MKSSFKIMSLIIFAVFFPSIAHSQIAMMSPRGGAMNLGNLGNRRVVKAYAGDVTISSRREIVRLRNLYPDFDLRADYSRFNQYPGRFAEKQLDTSRPIRRFSSADPMSSMTSLKQLREYRNRYRTVMRSSVGY